MHASCTAHSLQHPTPACGHSMTLSLQVCAHQCLLAHLSVVQVFVHRCLHACMTCVHACEPIRIPACTCRSIDASMRASAHPHAMRRHIFVLHALGQGTVQASIGRPPVVRPAVVVAVMASSHSWERPSHAWEDDDIEGDSDSDPEEDPLKSPAAAGKQF
eukprot:8041791-Alexandrium_andersonii.AAC.1